jgi:hypothetical protein
LTVGVGAVRSVKVCAICRVQRDRMAEPPSPVSSPSQK